MTRARPCRSASSSGRSASSLGPSPSSSRFVGGPAPREGQGRAPRRPGGRSGGRSLDRSGCLCARGPRRRGVRPCPAPVIRPESGREPGESPDPGLHRLRRTPGPEAVVDQRARHDRDVRHVRPHGRRTRQPGRARRPAEATCQRACTRSRGGPSRQSMAISPPGRSRSGSAGQPRPPRRHAPGRVRRRHPWAPRSPRSPAGG